LGLPCRLSFGDAERHLDSARTIAHVRFHLAIHAEPDSPTAKLNSGAKAHSALPGIGYADTVDLVVGQLLQPVPVESQPHVFEQFVGGRVVDVKDLSRLHVFNAESNKRIVIGGLPEIVALACVQCNKRKSDRTPQEAGLTLRHKPLEPNQFDPRFNFRLHIHALRPEWSDYKAYIYWNVELEK